MLVDLQKLGWRDFEDLITDILKAEGFKVSYRPGVGPDEGRDIIVERELDNSLESISKKYLVQCKRTKKNVAEKDVPNMIEKIRQHGCNGYLLAVSSDITEGLNKMLDGIKTNTSDFCDVWRAKDIIARLQKHDDILQRYFPEIYAKHRGIIGDDKIIAIFDKCFGRNPNDNELGIYRNIIRMNGITDISDISDILNDPDTIKVIDEIYQKLLGRKGDPVSYLQWGHFYKTMPYNERLPFIEDRIKESDEYSSKARFMYHPQSLNLPLGIIKFDTPGQVFHNWKVYHSGYKDGILKIGSVLKIDDTILNMKYVRLTSPGKEKEFRIAFIEGRNLPNKKGIIIDFIDFDFFQVFLLIMTDDNKPHFIQYINGPGADGIVVNVKEKTDYYQIFLKDDDFKTNGPFKRLDMNYYNDLSEKFDLRAISLIGVYLGVRGSIGIVNVLIY